MGGVIFELGLGLCGIHCCYGFEYIRVTSFISYHGNIKHSFIHFCLISSITQTWDVEGKYLPIRNRNTVLEENEIV